MVVSTSELMKACKQTAIIAREGGNVIRLHLTPGEDQIGKIQVLAETSDAGTSEVNLAAAITGTELTIAFNVRFLLEVLEVIRTPNVTIEMNTHNSPALIFPKYHDPSKNGELENFLCLLMPMQLNKE
jgi:DNA polymerase-3 subunit beta